MLACFRDICLAMTKLFFDSPATCSGRSVNDSDRFFAARIIMPLLKRLIRGVPLPFFTPKYKEGDSR